MHLQYFFCEYYSHDVARQWKVSCLAQDGREFFGEACEFDNTCIKDPQSGELCGGQCVVNCSSNTLQLWKCASLNVVLFLA